MVKKSACYFYATGVMGQAFEEIRICVNLHREINLCFLAGHDIRFTIIHCHLVSNRWVLRRKPDCRPVGLDTE